MSGLTGFQVPRFVEELAPHERTPPRTESPIRAPLSTGRRLSRGAATTSRPQSMMDPPVDHDEERISRHHPEWPELDGMTWHVFLTAVQAGAALTKVGTAQVWSTDNQTRANPSNRRGQSRS